MKKQERAPGAFYPGRSLRSLDLFFTDGVGFEIHVLAGLVENGGEAVENGEARAAINHLHDPKNIAEVAPLRIEIKSAFLKGLAPEKNGASEIGEAHSEVMPAGQERFTMTKVITLRVHDDCVGKNRVHRRMLLEEIAHRGERAGKVLLVTIQVGNNVTSGAFETAVDGIIHAPIFLDESLDAAVLRQPVLRAVIGTRILNNVLHRDIFLIGDRSNAELEPVRVSETGSDNRKIHRLGDSLAAGPDDATAGAGTR